MSLSASQPALVAGEVDVVGAPVAPLPALVEVLVGDVVHQALRSDAHLSPLLVSAGCRGGGYRETGWPASMRQGDVRHTDGGRLDLALEDLAGGALGQVVEEPDQARVLVGGDPLLDVGADLLGRQLLALVEDDRGADLLAPLVVGDADHRRFADLRVLVEHLLDLARVDVVAAADDQVLLAVDDVEVAVLVDAGHVAAVEPAAAHRLRGRVGALPVALHDVVAADHDLADLALGDRVVVLVDDLHLDPLDRGADRARLALAVGVVGAGDRRGLREAVALEHDRPEGLLEAAQDLDRHRGAAGDADAQRGGVEALALGVVQQRPVHRRHAVEVGDAVALHRRQRLAGVEFGHQGEAGADLQRGVHARPSGRRSGRAAGRRGRRRPRRSRRWCGWRRRRCGRG